MRGEAGATPRAARSLRHALLGLVAASALALAPASAQADVAYVGADKEVWISSLDGAIKERLSAGEGDWIDTAQSDTGWVVGVRNTPGRVAQLSTFRVWNPQGAAVYNGPLAGELGSNAYPLSLDLTNDGRGIIYGFSNFQSGSFTEGHYFLPSETVVSPVGGPYKQIDKRYPTLFGGTRVVAALDRTWAGVQDTGGSGSTTFVPWLNVALAPLTNVRIRRTDVAASGTVVAIEITNGLYDLPVDERIGVAPVSAIGGTFGTGDCFLPTDGNATSASLSQDGSAIAWTDSGGVKVGGIPDFSGAEPCVLTRPAVIIAGGGRFPSIGTMSAAAIRAARTPAVVPPPPTAAPKSGIGSASPTPPPASVRGRSVSVSIPALATKAGKCPARARVVVTAGPGLRASRLLRVVAATVGGRKVCRVTGVVRLARAPAKGVKVRVSVSGPGLRSKVVVAIRR